MPKWLPTLGIWVVLLVGFDLINGSTMMSTIYWKIFGLTGDNTAYDYNAASTEARLEFNSNMCNHGVCLGDIDRDCGWILDPHSSFYEPDKYRDDFEAVEDCFSTLVRKVDPWDKLDKVRKICGRYNAHILADRRMDEKKERCKAAGGKWGEQNNIWTDEKELLRRIGLPDR